MYVRLSLKRMRKALKARRKTSDISAHQAKTLSGHALAAWNQYTRDVDKKRRGLHAVSCSNISLGKSRPEILESALKILKMARRQHFADVTISDSP